jgi:hypothetical protein
MLMPTYSKLVVWSLAAAFLSLLVIVRSWGPFMLSATAITYQVAEVGVALVIMRAEPRFILSLVFAPVFLAWKIAIDLLASFGHRGQSWTRAARQPHTKSTEDAGDEVSRVASENGTSRSDGT